MWSSFSRYFLPTGISVGLAAAALKADFRCWPVRQIDVSTDAGRRRSVAAPGAKLRAYNGEVNATGGQVHFEINPVTDAGHGIIYTTEGMLRIINHAPVSLECALRARVDCGQGVCPVVLETRAAGTCAECGE
jgi:hypothetical protein